jgi:hypothetical protein
MRFAISHCLNVAANGKAIFTDDGISREGGVVIITSVFVRHDLALASFDGCVDELFLSVWWSACA